MFFTFLISSLIRIIPSALPILLILSVVVFPSFWNIGATLCDTSPCATIIAVIISVASISMSPVTPLPFSVSIVSRPSSMSSPSSISVTSSFSSIQLKISLLIPSLSFGQLSVSLTFFRTISNSVPFHLSSMFIFLPSIPLADPSSLLEASVSSLLECSFLTSSFPDLCFHPSGIVFCPAVKSTLSWL